MGSARRPPERKQENIPALRAQYQRREPAEMVEYKDLPRWVRTALVRVEVLGETLSDAAKAFKHSPSTLQSYNQSPAARAWREELSRFSNDPRAMAEAVMRGTTLTVSLDYLLIYDKAIEAGDLALAAKISQDLMDRGGVVKKVAKSESPTSIVINLPGASALEIPLGTSEYKQLGSGESGPVVDAQIVE